MSFTKHSEGPIGKGFLQAHLKEQEIFNESPSLKTGAGKVLLEDGLREEWSLPPDTYPALPITDDLSQVGGILDDDTKSLYHILSILHGSASRGYSENVDKTIELGEKADELIKKLGHDRASYKLDETIVDRLKRNIGTVANSIKNDEHRNSNFDRTVQEAKKAATIGRKFKYAESHFYEPIIDSLLNTTRKISVHQYTSNSLIDNIKNYGEDMLALRKLANKLSGYHGLGNVLVPINVSISSNLFLAIETLALKVTRATDDEYPSQTYKEVIALAKWGRKQSLKLEQGYLSSNYDILISSLKSAKEKILS